MANMLQLILKNFISKKKTRLFPLSIERPAFERSRGRIILNTDTCILCGLCARRCPADAITVDRKEGKWELDAFRCIICGECASACPKKSIIMSNDRRHASEDKEIITHKVEVPVPAVKPAAAKPAAAKKAQDKQSEMRNDANVAVTLEKSKVETIDPQDKEKSQSA